MIWNTIKSINSIIWSEFKKNKILFIIPMLLSVFSYLFDVYNSRMLKSIVDVLLAEVSENKINSSILLNEIAERSFIKSGNILTSGFCDWYYSPIFTFISGIFVLCMPFILTKLKFKIQGMLFFKVYAWIIWIPVGFGSIALFINGFFYNNPYDIMSLKLTYALSQSMLLIITLGILSVICLISLIQIYYYFKFSNLSDSDPNTNDSLINLISQNIFKLFIWNSLFTFLMLLTSSINLIEQAQVMLNTVLISRETIAKWYPYQTYLRLLIVPWLLLIPFQIVKSSSSLKCSIIEGFNIVKRDIRRYFGIYCIILVTLFLIEFIVDWIVVGFSHNCGSTVLHLIEIILSTYFAIGLFAVYFKKYYSNEEVLIRK